MAKRKTISWPAILGIFVLLAIMAIMVGPFEAWEVMERAKKLQTANGARALKQAVEAIESEYLVPPKVGKLDFPVDSPEGRQILTILLGNEDVGDSMQNKKQIPFLNTKVNKNRNKGGLVYANGGVSRIPDGLYDAWGNPFRVILRPPGSSRLTFLHAGKTVTLDDTVAVISNGPDGKEGGGDDITTW
jgi:hypothetical protein